MLGDSYTLYQSAIRILTPFFFFSISSLIVRFPRFPFLFQTTREILMLAAAIAIVSGRTEIEWPRTRRYFLTRYYLRVLLGWSRCFEDSARIYGPERARYIGRRSTPPARDEKLGRLLSVLGITKNIRGRLIAAGDNAGNVITMYTRTGVFRGRSVESSNTPCPVLLSKADGISLPEQFQPLGCFVGLQINYLRVIGTLDRRDTSGNSVCGRPMVR